LLHQFDPFGAASGFSNDIDLLVGHQEGTQPPPDDGMIINK
jgi:hypothetical protein